MEGIGLPKVHCLEVRETTKDVDTSPPFQLASNLLSVKEGCDALVRNQQVMQPGTTLF